MAGIEIITENGSTTPTTKEPTSSPSVPEPPLIAPLDLSVSLNFPGRFYLRGRGADIEWQGHLKIAGNTAAPTVTGQFELVRGSVNLLGKRFTFEHGIIQFPDQQKIQPVLDVTAVHTSGDLTVYLKLTGDVTNLVLSLSSIPAYPRDEILARLLFGRELNQITPLQAVKLAFAVRALSRDDLGFMDRIRNFTGLDQLELQTGEGGSENVIIGVGKYLRENVYFKVEKEIIGDATEITVEIELTPHFRVESQTGSGAHGVQLKWQYRY